jgi:YHS domain-containing protein
MVERMKRSKINCSEWVNVTFELPVTTPVPAQKAVPRRGPAGREAAGQPAGGFAPRPACSGTRAGGRMFFEGWSPRRRITRAVNERNRKKPLMKTTKKLAGCLVAAAFLIAPSLGSAAEKAAAKPKPYPLEKCVVSDEKLGEMGKPYVFTHEGREIKLCCKSCLKDFKKDPAKYMKKLEAAEAKAKK